MTVRFGFAMGGSNVKPPPLKQRVKRGGSGTAALTNTLDPSAYPTSPPESKYKSGVPKVGGSEGGFIGLIVGLGVLILVCLGTVYYLLRTRKHGGRAGNKNYPPDATASSSKGFFSSLPFSNARKQDAGWVQQGDEFDYDSGDEDLMSRKDPNMRAPKGLGYVVGLKGYGEGGTGYTGQAGPSMRGADSPPADAYTDPFDPHHLPESVHRQQAPLPTSTSASNEPPLYKSVESDGPLKGSPTTPTFEGGTKFREQF